MVIESLGMRSVRTLAVAMLCAGLLAPAPGPAAALYDGICTQYVGEQGWGEITTGAPPAVDLVRVSMGVRNGDIIARLHLTDLDGDRYGKVILPVAGRTDVDMPSARHVAQKADAFYQVTFGWGNNMYGARAVFSSGRWYGYRLEDESSGIAETIRFVHHARRTLDEEDDSAWDVYPTGGRVDLEKDRITLRIPLDTMQAETGYEKDRLLRGIEVRTSSRGGGDFEPTDEQETAADWFHLRTGCPPR